MRAGVESLSVSESPTVTRRSIIRTIQGLWVAIAVALGAPASAYLFRAPKVRQTREWIPVGDVSTLPSAQPVEMVFQHNHDDGWKTINEKLSAWVVRTSDGKIEAFGPRCTHLGCAHHWDATKKNFICPCHNSVFSIEGRVLAGPASRPLDRYDVKIEGTQLLVGSLRKSPENIT